MERLRRILPASIYWKRKFLDIRGLGYGGPEWKRRLMVINRLSQKALEQERAGEPPQRIFDYIGANLTRQGIGWVESEHKFAVTADHEKGIYPRSIVAKQPGSDTDKRQSGWMVYYEGEAAERDQYPEKFRRAS